MNWWYVLYNVHIRKYWSVLVCINLNDLIDLYWIYGMCCMYGI